MDDFTEKRKKLNAIREEAGKWLDPGGVEAAVRGHHTNEIKRFEAQISSSNFLHDHDGYILALGNLQAHRRALETLDTAQARYNRAVAELKQLDEDEKVVA